MNKANDPQVTDVVDKTEVVEPVNTRRYTRWGWLIVLVGVVGSLTWMGLAPLDQGVPVSGHVIVSGQRKVVQHPSGGIVDEVLVRDGALVKAGQVVARMNTTQAKAEAEMLRIQVLTGRATEARLLAEHTGQSAVEFPDSMSDLGGADVARVSAVQALQRQLFDSRRTALQSELAGIDEALAGIGFQLRALKSSQQEKQAQLVSMDEQLGNMRDLAKDGYVPRNRVLELERMHAQLKGAIADDVGNIGRLEKQINEIGLRRTQRVQEYQRDVRAQLAEVQRDTESAAQRLEYANFMLSNTEVKSPVDGVVVGLTVFTPGAVIGPGARLLDVVPQDAPLEVEAQVPVHLIDKVKANVAVELMFTALNQSKTPHIPGMVTKVSADRLIDEHSGMPYFKLYATTTEEGAKRLRDQRITAGMPVEVFVKTGERTMLNYLIKPLFDRAHSALREE